MINNKKWFTKIIFTHEEIVARIKELALWINEEYKDSKNFVIVSLLKGSFPFVAELIKHINIVHVIDFMIVSSFGGNINSTGNIKIEKDLEYDIFNYDVLIVEDIIDTGKTLTKVHYNLETRKPKSIKIMTLLNKNVSKSTNLKIDKYGFKVDNVFVAGFGMDVKEKLRNVPFIGIFNQKLFNEL